MSNDNLRVRGSRAMLIVLSIGAFAFQGCKKPVPGAGDAAADAAPDTGVADDSLTDAAADSAPPALTAPTIVAPPSPFAEGQTWSGSYTCPQGDTQLTLIVHSGGQKVSLVFSFKKDKVVGQFKMNGAYTAASRHLHLTAGEWISRPGNYGTVDLDGKVSPDGHTFSGSVIAPGCTVFSVHH